MKHCLRQIVVAGLAGAACVLAVHAQDIGAPAGDPARWYNADSSEQEQLRTLRKEIGAAYREAQAACRQLPGAERNSCARDARATYRQDLANARQLIEAAPR